MSVIWSQSWPRLASESPLAVGLGLVGLGLEACAGLSQNPRAKSANVLVIMFSSVRTSAYAWIFRHAKTHETGCISSLTNRHVVPTEQNRRAYRFPRFRLRRPMPHIIFAKNTACRAAKLS